MPSCYILSTTETPKLIIQAIAIISHAILERTLLRVLFLITCQHKVGAMDILGQHVAYSDRGVPSNLCQPADP